MPSTIDKKKNKKVEKTAKPRSKTLTKASRSKNNKKQVSNVASKKSKKSSNVGKKSLNKRNTRNKNIKSKKNTKNEPKSKKNKKNKNKNKSNEINDNNSNKDDNKDDNNNDDILPENMTNILSLEVLERYKEKFGKNPDNPQQLVKYGRKTSIKLTFKDAKALMGLVGDPHQKYKIGEGVLLTKDRTGIIRFYGKVPEMQRLKGAECYEKMYGIELTNGSCGSNNGQIGNNKYFECPNKKGIFVFDSEIRRALTQRDHKRTQSYLNAKKEKEFLQARNSKLLTVPKNL